MHTNIADGIKPKAQNKQQMRKIFSAFILAQFSLLTLFAQEETRGAFFYKKEYTPASLPSFEE